MITSLSSAPAPAPVEIDPVPGWTVEVCAKVASTQPLAARLPAWHAVRAGVQTAGRGRTGRHWVSNAGGLWLSAVLPCPGPRETWAPLPLAAGWALLAALTALGARDLRLRWPNDILAGRRKLAGLLVERYHPDTAVVGLGLNVFNRPEQLEPGLSDATVRLADLVDLEGYDLGRLTTLVLPALARAQRRLAREGIAPIAVDLNRTWGEPRRVLVDLAGEPAAIEGLFKGIDSRGRLLLNTVNGRSLALDAHHVALLRELDS